MRGKPIVEAYIGEYASGKSENAVNRALALTKTGIPVTLVDLDTVEPCYTLRPIKRQLEGLGIQVVAWETQDTLGLGEAGSVIHPAMRWVLRREGHVILDIGYGVHGAKIFNLIEGALEHPQLQILAVINMSRPITYSVEAILDYVKELGRVDGLVNNTHLGPETTAKLVQKGAVGVSRAARLLGIPMVATSAPTEIAAEIGNVDCAGNPVWPLQQYMAQAFW